MIVVRIAMLVLGVFVVQSVLRSAVRTVVVPRGEHVLLPRVVFLTMRRFYETISRRSRADAERHDQIFARFAPMSLVLLAGAWVIIVAIGFVPIYWAISDLDLRESMMLSGSSITTLGFVAPPSTVTADVAFLEALIGLGVLALLISFLPTIYGHFSRREARVAMLETRAGSPPSAASFLRRYHSLGWLDRLDEEFAGWEAWFAELEESHTSQPSLALFRSQRPNNSWITGAGAVLDTAAVMISSLDVPPSPQGSVMIRAGYLSLRAIADFYDVPFDPDPAPNDPIFVSRAEYEALLDELAAEGLPVRTDREQAWRAFAGWRVNYDLPLLALCRIANAPRADWSSDRIDGFVPISMTRTRSWRIPPVPNGPSW